MMRSGRAWWPAWDAPMASEERVAQLRKAVWNAWRKANPDIRPDLGGADLGGADRAGCKSAQDDKWSFCLTAGTLCPANQEKQ
jgi:hypothetical protein